MSLYLKRVLLLCLAIALSAAEAGWRGKPTAAWTEADAHELLASSPWSETVRATRLPDLTPEQRVQGGATGGGNGSGLAGLTGDLRSGIRESSSRSSNAGRPVTEAVRVRWESALPVRVAELKGREVAAPDWEGDYYAISVRDVPGWQGDYKHTHELKRLAELQLGKRKKVNPVRVEVFPQSSGQTTFLYLFPRIAGATLQDNEAAFTAQIGRLCVSHQFVLTEMLFQNKLEL